MAKGRQLIDLTGQRFGAWIVLGPAPVHISPSGQRSTMFYCQCDCGHTETVFAAALRAGKATCCWDCGVKKRTKHERKPKDGKPSNRELLQTILELLQKMEKKRK